MTLTPSSVVLAPAGVTSPVQRAVAAPVFLGEVTDVHNTNGDGIAVIEGSPRWYQATPATRGVKVGTTGKFEADGHSWTLVWIPSPTPATVTPAPTGAIPDATTPSISISNPAARSSGGAPSSYSKAWTDAQDQYMGVTLRGKIIELIDAVESLAAAVTALGGNVNTVKTRAVAAATAANGVRGALVTERIVQ